MQRKKLALLPLRSWRPWRLKLDDLSPYHTVGNLQSSHTDWQLEAPWPGAAGIEVKHTVFHFLFRFVRVAADHHLESRCLRMQIERIHIMQNVDTDSRQFYNFCLRKAAAPGFLIDIAANGSDRRNFLQDGNNIFRTNIPGMNDVL